MIVKLYFSIEDGNLFQLKIALTKNVLPLSVFLSYFHVLQYEITKSSISGVFGLPVSTCYKYYRIEFVGSDRCA